MDISKRTAFVQRRKMSKGGLVRHLPKYDDGGYVAASGRNVVNSPGDGTFTKAIQTLSNPSSQPPAMTDTSGLNGTMAGGGDNLPGMRQDGSGDGGGLLGGGGGLALLAYKGGAICPTCNQVPHFDAGGTVPGAQGDITQHGGLMGSLTTQNNFEGTTAPTTNIAYSPGYGTGVTQQAQGYGNVQNEIDQQQQLAGTLQAESQGAGPNPALNQLQASTGQNIASQGALMAGQRGAAANPALLARQVGQQGAATQQQAVGQAATLQAQQELAQQQQLQQQQANIAGESINQAAAGNNLLSTSGQLNNTQNANDINNWNNAQTINAAAAQNNANATNATTSGLINGVASQASGQGLFSTIGGLFKYKGGNVCDGPGGHVASYLAMAKGGRVPAMVSPGEGYLSPEQAKAVAEGTANPLKVAQRIPGKAKVKGDSIKNDTVPVNLDEGGVVIPRHIMNTMSPEKAELFVHRALARKQARR